jgi:hypothetical protein
MVFAAGHKESEIVEELERIKNGESWVGFNNLPTTTMQKSKSVSKGQTQE